MAPVLTGSGQLNQLLTINDTDAATVSFQATTTTPAKTIPRGRLSPGPHHQPGNTLENGANDHRQRRQWHGRERRLRLPGLPEDGHVCSRPGNGATQTVSFDPASDTLVEGDETVTLSIREWPVADRQRTIDESGHHPRCRQRHHRLPTGHDDRRRGRSGHGNPVGPLDAPGNTLENKATISMSATNGSAVNNDYDSALFPKTMTFTAGQGNGGTQTVSFDPASDTLVEGDETVTLTINNGALLTASGQITQVVTIKDADSGTSVQFTLASFSANENDGTTSVVTLSRSGDVGHPVAGASHAGWRDGHGGQRLHRGGFPLMVNFAADQTTQTVPPTLVNDTLVEGLQTVVFQVVLWITRSLARAVQPR